MAAVLMISSKLTGTEFQGATLDIHREVGQIHWASSFYCQPIVLVFLETKSLEKPLSPFYASRRTVSLPGSDLHQNRSEHISLCERTTNKLLFENLKYSPALNSKKDGISHILRFEKFLILKKSLLFLFVPAEMCSTILNRTHHKSSHSHKTTRIKYSPTAVEHPSVLIQSHEFIRCGDCVQIAVFAVVEIRVGLPYSGQHGDAQCQGVLGSSEC